MRHCLKLRTPTVIVCSWPFDRRSISERHAIWLPTYVCQRSDQQYNKPVDFESTEVHSFQLLMCTPTGLRFVAKPTPAPRSENNYAIMFRPSVSFDNIHFSAQLAENIAITRKVITVANESNLFLRRFCMSPGNDAQKDENVVWFLSFSVGTMHNRSAIHYEIMSNEQG